ncbi:NUDIX domain-containing protein [Streptomyces sp. ISL-100]|uniref:NUDIX domain-containing protein n=1 Tax=Streptomyces sp. ISL-100 TaxID=2819173 RepID=UPI001BEA2B82|nr:NUDIX domain-containing protein [Streptomyces sp. ISL-100]MBT2394437.1 NUDIX domain-containing protein [Streptomyces sp. ISL-100]
MTATRYTSVVDVLILLQRADGRVLLVRRAETEYAGGLLSIVGGHLERGEFADDGARREAHEEVGVEIDPADTEFCGAAHYLGPEDERRICFAFTAQRWLGEPYNREPHKHTALVWAEPGNPPPDCHAYSTAVLRQFVVGGSLYANIAHPRRPR